MSRYIAVDDARTQILKIIEGAPTGQERVPLAKALGRTLAEPIRAPQEWPPFARAAMDGFAFRAEDTPGTLHVIGTLYAGDVWDQPLKPGEAIRIMTGAPVPPGANTVLEQERVTDGPAIAVLDCIRPHRNIMPQGHEYREGDAVLPQGSVLSPLALGQLAAFGLAEVSTAVPPRVLILTTGDEVQSGGKPLKPGRIYDATGPLLAALLTEMGARPSHWHVPDQPKRLLGAFDKARSGHFRLIITTGGVSVGQRDYLPELLERHFDRLFWRVDMHPGKATAAAVLDKHTPIVALSGNPGASLTAWYLLVAPLAAALTGRSYALRAIHGRLLHPYPKSTRETRYLKARFQFLKDGIGFEVIDNQSSDALRSFAEADGLVVIPHGSPPQEAGQVLEGLWLPR